MSFNILPLGQDKVIIRNTGQITNTTRVDTVMEKVIILDRGG